MTNYESDCSTECGQAQYEQRRTVQCHDINGTSVREGYCTEEKPETVRMCDETRQCGMFFVMFYASAHVIVSVPFCASCLFFMALVPVTYLSFQIFEFRLQMGTA